MGIFIFLNIRMVDIQFCFIQFLFGIEDVNGRVAISFGVTPETLKRSKMSTINRCEG